MGVLEALSSHTQYKLRPPPTSTPPDRLPRLLPEEVGLEETGAHGETPFQGFFSGSEEFAGCLFSNKRGCLSSPSHHFSKGGYSVSQKVKNPSRGHLCPIYHKSLHLPPSFDFSSTLWLGRLSLPSAPSCPVPPLQEGHPAFLPSLPVIRTH